jgi:predicted RNase H-like HicB family nuclease
MNKLTKDLEYYAKLPYTIILEKYNDHGGYWVARIVELPFCLIDGNTPEEALKEIEEVKLEWLQSNLEDGRPIPEPVDHDYSGEIRVRMPPTLHKALTYRAAAEEVSLNQFMVMALARAVGYPESEKKSVEKESKQEFLTVKETKRKYTKK